MSVTPHKPSGNDPDLDATDELPILPLADADADAESGTATFATLPALDELPDLAESLRHVESHLKRKSERVRELEAQLAVVDAERRELRTEIDAERHTAAEQLQTERRSSAELLQRERAAAAEQLDQERRAATAQLEAERKSANGLLDRTRQEALAKLEGERAAAARGAEELAGRLAVAERDLADVRGRLEAREADLASTSARLADHERQVAELRTAADRRDTEMRHQARDFAELRRRAERLHEALRHGQGFRGVLEAQLADHEHQLSTIEARHAADHAGKDAALRAELQQLRTDSDALQARLESELRQRSGELTDANERLQAAEGKVSALGAQVEAQLAQIAAQQEELSALRATDEAARAGIELFEKQRRHIAELEGELSAAREQAGILEQRLRELEEQNQRLETEARASVSLLGNLQQDIVRLGREDTGARPALKLVSSSHVPARYLVGEIDGQEVQHALGRRTSIGRTPDNEIQIDAGYVSRHHAVILASAQHCIIEDLNSMNGVLVNGRRVSRHALRNGDTVTIGKSVFRFRQAD